MTARNSKRGVVPQRALRLVAAGAALLGLMWPTVQADEFERISQQVKASSEIPFPYRVQFRRINVGRSGAVPLRRDEFEALLRKSRFEAGGEAFKAFSDETCIHAKIYEMPWQSGTTTLDGRRFRVDSEMSLSGSQTRVKDLELYDGQHSFQKSSNSGMTQIDVSRGTSVSGAADPASYRYAAPLSALTETRLERQAGLFVISGRLSDWQVQVRLDDQTLLLREEWRTDGDRIAVVYQVGTLDCSGVPFPRFSCRVRFKNERLSALTATILDSVEKVDVAAPDLFTISATQGDTIVDHSREWLGGKQAVSRAPADTKDLGRVLTSPAGWADP